MPRGDRSGPNGMGPMTGRGAGFCNGYNAPGFMNNGVAGSGYGRGAGMGAGRGFGGRHMGGGYGRGYGYGQPYGSYNAAVPIGYSKEAETGAIENEIAFLKDQLKAMESRLGEMKKVEE